MLFQDAADHDAHFGTDGLFDRPVDARVLFDLLDQLAGDEGELLVAEHVHGAFVGCRGVVEGGLVFIQSQVVAPAMGVSYFLRQPDPFVDDFVSRDGSVLIDQLSLLEHLRTLPRLDHVDYVVKKFGIDHVGIGTDLGDRSRNDAAELKKVPPRAKRRTRYEALWPDDAFLTGAEADKRYPKSKSLAWTNWPMFTVGLVQRGYSDEQIETILGLNMLRIAQENLAR